MTSATYGRSTVRAAPPAAVAVIARSAMSPSLRSALVTLLLAAAARADPSVPVIGRDARTAVAVTIYNQDLALVKDTRAFPIPAGESALRFGDGAA
jgi:hypothetical protein